MEFETSAGPKSGGETQSCLPLGRKPVLLLKLEGRRRNEVCLSGKFVSVLLKKGRSLPKQQIRDLATGPKSQIRSKMSAVSSKSALWAESETSDPAQNRKVVYPPPRNDGIQGVDDGQPKMGLPNPTFARGSRSTPPKIGLF